MSKTASLLNIAGRKLDDDPQPVLYIGPTKSNLESVIEPQITAMLQDVASLRAKTPGGKKQKKMMKRVGAVTLRLAWANSPTELASQPAHTVIVDERDKMGPIKGEGDPVELAIARVATYPDSKVFQTSSPTEGTVTSSVHPESGLEHWDLPEAPEDVASPIWRAWQEGTRHEWAVPCVHCDRYFIPRFKLLKWPEGASPRVAQREAKLVCPNCGGLMDESHKARMNERGRAVAPGQRVVDGEVVGAMPDTDIYSLWVSGLMSNWVTFGQRAAAWLRAVASGDQERIRSQVNTRFGELYQLRGHAPEWQSVRDLGKLYAAGYKVGDTPKAVLRIFVTGDVQKDRIVCVARGWGPEFASWLLHTEELWGDTDQPEVYARFSQLAAREFGGIRVHAAALDSGYRTERVYEWAHQNRSGLRGYATKGRESPSKLYAATDVEVSRNGKRLFQGLKLWTIDHSYFKGFVHDRLVWPQDQPGAWHIPVDVSDDYCRQIVAEQRMRLPSGGVQWVGTGANHYLDCEALQVFLAHVEGVRHLKADAGTAKRPSLADIARSLNG